MSGKPDTDETAVLDRARELVAEGNQLRVWLGRLAEIKTSTSVAAQTRVREDYECRLAAAIENLTELSDEVMALKDERLAGKAALMEARAAQVDRRDELNLRFQIGEIDEPERNERIALVNDEIESLESGIRAEEAVIAEAGAVLGWIDAAAESSKEVADEVDSTEEGHPEAPPDAPEKIAEEPPPEPPDQPPVEPEVKVVVDAASSDAPEEVAEEPPLEPPDQPPVEPEVSVVLDTAPPDAPEEVVEEPPPEPPDQPPAGPEVNVSLETASPDAPEEVAEDTMSDDATSDDPPADDGDLLADEDEDDDWIDSALEVLGGAGFEFPTIPDPKLTTEPEPPGDDLPGEDSKDEVPGNQEPPGEGPLEEEELAKQPSGTDAHAEEHTDDAGEIQGAEEAQGQDKPAGRAELTEPEVEPNPPEPEPEPEPESEGTLEASEAHNVVPAPDQLAFLESLSLDVDTELGWFADESD